MEARPLTITPEYILQNSKLHEADAAFGAGAWRKAAAILEIFHHGGYQTLLDFGCGKSSLKDALPEINILEYDPAIPGKDTPPERADMVACLDVLEHVEPDLLDNLLAELARLTIHEMFFTICTRPAHKTLPDGRNAHLIVEDANWWGEQLEKHFQIGLHQVYKDVFWGSASPLGSVGAIRGKMAVGHDTRNDYVRRNVGREPLRLLDQGSHAPHDRRAILVCFGPTLIDTLQEVAAQADDPNVDIYSVSAAHKMLIDNGIVPWAHLDCDPRDHKVTQIGPAHPDVRYWLASCVHPSYLDHVASGRETRLWHAYNGPMSEVFLNGDLKQKAKMVVGGGSVGLRALTVLYGCGYRDIELHGMDCSFKNGEQHAGEHHGKRKGVIKVKTPDGREFETSAALILYFRYFYKQVLWMQDADITLCGDGMLQHSIRNALR